MNDQTKTEEDVVVVRLGKPNTNVIVMTGLNVINVITTSPISSFRFLTVLFLLNITVKWCDMYTVICSVKFYQKPPYYFFHKIKVNIL